MWRVAFLALLACSACKATPQPRSARTVAAYEVPIPTASDRDALIVLLRQEAQAEGCHVDTATAEQLKVMSKVSPTTINAALWRGKDDDEPIASVMDGAGHLGFAWLTFFQSEVPERAARLRTNLVRRILARWPKTQVLPIMPTGAIPFHEDLLLTEQGYRVKREAASKYELPASSPLVSAD